MGSLTHRPLIEYPLREGQPLCKETQNKRSHMTNYLFTGSITLSFHPQERNIGSGVRADKPDTRLSHSRCLAPSLVVTLANGGFQSL